MMLTSDRSMKHRQNLRTLPLAVLVTDSDGGDLDHLRSFVPAVLAAIPAVKPRTVSHVR